MPTTGMADVDQTWVWRVMLLGIALLYWSRRPAKTWRHDKVPCCRHRQWYQWFTKCVFIELRKLCNDTDYNCTIHLMFYKPLLKKIQIETPMKLSKISSNKCKYPKSDWFAETRTLTHYFTYSVIYMQRTIFSKTWWRHQMGVFSGLLTVCAGNSPVTAEFPSHTASNAGFNVCLMWARISC